MARKNPFQSWLDEILNEVWDAQVAYEWSENRLADEAGLCYGTVHRLYEGITQEPRASTIFKLARAVGMTVKMIKEVRRKHAA
jgi:hypothetical protein